MPESKSSADNNARGERLVYIVSVLNVLFALLIKTGLAIISDSLILYGEFVDALSDIAVVFITFIALKESSKPADLRHMYGHYKINSFAALIQGAILALLYIDVGYKAVLRLINDPFASPDRSDIGVWALVILTAVSLVSSSIIISYGKKKKNLLIISQGENFRGDFLRNISQILGLVLITFGFGILDPIIALIFSIRSIIVGYKIIKQSYDELTDSSNILEDDIEKLENLIKEKCVPKFIALRLRTLGNTIYLQVDFIADGQAEQINQQTRLNLKKIMKKMFPDYEANILVNYQSEKKEKLDVFDKTLAAIKEIGIKHGNEFELHNISIDKFIDGAIVKLDMKVNGNITLREANEMTDQLRGEIVMSVQNIMNISNVEFIQHIEPKSIVARKHEHKIENPDTKSIEAFIRAIIEKHSEIKGTQLINIQQEDNQLYIFIKILLEPDTQIFEVHRIMENLENSIRNVIENIAQCSIQAMPIE